MPSATSSRWCPTPEQLMILEEMYRSGTRTPNASQIQHITAHLSLYGKIEGKNVFYWFQNHKARDRQKLRRKLMSKQLHLQQEQLQNPNHQFPHPHLLLHQYESHPPPPLALPQFSYYAPLRFLPQDGIKDASTQVISYPMKVDPLPEGCKSMARTYGGDWMIMLDVGATAPTCCNRPLKTLELFPLNTTGLKEECTTSKLNPSTPIN